MRLHTLAADQPPDPQKETSAQPVKAKEDPAQPDKTVDPRKAAESPNDTRYYIHAIGDGTLVVNSCLTPTRFAVKTNEKTAVIRLDGQTGKLSDLKVGQWVKFRQEGNSKDPEQHRIAMIEVVTDVVKPVDEKKAATAEVVVRGTPIPDAESPGRGGWPTYSLSVTQVFKMPKDMRIEVGQKLTIKTIKVFEGPVTLYLVFDKDQKHYRLQDPLEERGFSHVDAEGEISFDTYSGYFVSNKYEPNAAESFLVITDQEKFDQVFGVAFVMNDKSHRLPKDAFKSLIVLSAIKRGAAVWEFKVNEVTEASRVVEVYYTATSKKSDSATFACPLFVSIPKGRYTTVRFVENGKTVKKIEIQKKR